MHDDNAPPNGPVLIPAHPIVPSPSAVPWMRGEAPPGSPLYVTPDDTVLLQGISSLAGVTISARLRFMQLDGRVTSQLLQLQPAANRTNSVAQLRLADGYILSAAVSAEGTTVRRGQVYATLGLQRGLLANAEPYEQMCAGYPTTGDPLSWPEEAPDSQVDEQGIIQRVTQAAPGAGAEILFSVPAGARWRFESMRFQLVTAVAAANRFVHVLIDDGAGNIMHDVAAPVQAASLTFTYSVGAGIGPSGPTDNTVLLPMPHDPYLLQGWRIRTLTTAIQAADQYSAPQLAVMEWLEL